MSAYQVHSDTIDLLITAADAWRLTFENREGTDAARLHACSHRDEAGQLLTDENARSVNYRYREDETAPKYSYRFISLESAAVGMPVAVLVLGSVRCLRYQSCEAPDYAETRAARFLDGIEAEACRRLIDTHDAPWGFTRDWMTIKTAEIRAKVQATLNRVK
jgi:hypothetical protein